VKPTPVPDTDSVGWCGALGYSVFVDSGIMPSPIALYSTYTWLAFTINQQYYGGDHYVWCTPHFEPGSPFLSSPSAVPPTSSPKMIYTSLFEEVTAGDRHSAKVAQNRLGIQRGADVQFRKGTISTAVRDEILSIVDAAEVRDFRPLLFVIPFAPVASLLVQVPIKARAHPLAEEYILSNLPRAAFDVLEIR
jgi:hypothetical protein